MRPLARRLLEAYETLLGWLSFVAPTLVRLVLGYAMWVDGQGKLQHLDNVTKFFSTLYVPFTSVPLPHPELQAHFIALLEDYGGFLVMIGFLTRPVSLLLAGAMVGAVLMSDSGEFIRKWVDATPTDATSFIDFVLAIVLLFTGAGPLSVDGILAFFFRQWVEPGPPLRTRLGGIVTCWVLRGLVILALAAIVPVSDAPAETMVHLGLRTRLVRPPHPGEFDENPPSEVVEYPPDVPYLALYALALAGVGGGLYGAFRVKAAEASLTKTDRSV